MPSGQRIPIRVIRRIRGFGKALSRQVSVISRKSKELRVQRMEATVTRIKEDPATQRPATEFMTGRDAYPT
jgi:hypothetical protein